MNGKESSSTYPFSVVFSEFMRHMFLAPDPGVTEEIRDLMADNQGEFWDVVLGNTHNDQVIEAFRRGQQSTAKG
jgi:hypothetical protein